MGVRVTPQGDTINSFAIAIASGVQTFPSVVFNGTDYIAVWSDSRLGRYYINTTRITPSGTIPGPYYWIGVSGAQDEDDPDIAFNGTHCLSVWSEEYYGVRGRFINNLGQPEDTVLTITPYVITSYTTPAIASDGNNFMVVWYERSGSGDWDVLGQLVSSNGILIGGQIPIATGSNAQYDSDVLFDGINYFIVWRETNNYIYGRRYDVNGNPIGSSIPVSQLTAIYRYQPTLINSTQNYLIAWSEMRGGYFDVYGNIDIIPIGITESDANPLCGYAKLTPTLTIDQCLLYYSILGQTNIRVILYDIDGRKVECLLDTVKKPGDYKLKISTRPLPTGIYFLSIETEAGIITKKLTVLKK